MDYTQDPKTEILKFIAQYPFKEVYFGGDGFSQILKIDYSAQEVTLRDFCEYEVDEIIRIGLFKDTEIESKWRFFLNSLTKTI